MRRRAHLAAPLAGRVLVRDHADVVLGYHVIFTAYGFWLPNDPRGSWSDFVASWQLCLHGRATKTTKKRSLAAVPHDVNKRRAVKLALTRPPVRFSGAQAQSIGHEFRRAAVDGGYVCHACAVLPDHVHLVLARHSRPIKQIVGHLKAMASRELAADGRHPFEGNVQEDGSLPTPWVKGCWEEVFGVAQGDDWRN
jgi:REP element-mobilizing transposase RayT